ncbi:MAG TPA: gliding motility-associated C-terminal domain-containing protein, partial [Cryomorphaceae bacterium]|nr:gliding motility-associated C-terminal domain-containing protein [Cryomorphaceae bacterium]
TDDPNVEVLQILGEWYLLPQDGFADGELTVNLTEYGFCGLDVDQEVIVLGPTLQPSIMSNDACRGELVTLIPVLEEDAELVWQLTPDSSVATDFPLPFPYSQPGLYFPSLTASANGYCTGTYVDTVEIFEPSRPLLLCDADCDGGRGCEVNFDAVSVCVGVQNPQEYSSIEWYVRRQFFPGAEAEIEIAVDDLVPCEENRVRMVGFDTNGCRVEVAENIEFTDVLLYAPNAFTPNADGYNDVFKPVISGAPVDYSIHIFDRWGNTVFESNDPYEPWHGNVEGRDFYNDPEIYSYIIKFLPCQPEEEEKEMVVTGMITLIR